MKPTKGAQKAAEIIMGEDVYIFTTYGRKTAEGLADLIDRQTAAPDMLAALERCHKALFDHVFSDEPTEMCVFADIELGVLEVIRKARGE